MRRRDFLTAVGSSILGACVTSVAPSPSPTASPAATDTPAPTPSPPPSRSAAPPVWSKLAGSLKGTLLLPNATGYDDARLLYNPRFDNIRPQAIARCATVDDVKACVLFARANSLHPALRSGGHHYVGWSTGPGMMIDVSPMSGMAVGNGTVTVAAGGRLVDVYDAVAARGVGIPAGSCPTVGITGLTLGGGIGVLTRAWGLTCDQLVAAEVVTADGAVRVCDARSEPDLFWALRGGGGGNFGVVTSLTLTTRPISALAIGFLSWPWSSAATAVAGWQSWMAKAPAPLWSTLHLDAGGGAPSLSIHVVYPASTAALDAQLNALVSTIGSAPDYRESGSRSYRDVMLLEAGCLGRSVAACHLKGTTPEGVLGRETFAATSIIADRPLSSQAIGTLVDDIAFAAARGPAGSVLIDALGGAVADVAPDASAFPHRAAFAVLQLYASWDPSTRNADPTLAWLGDLHARARPLIGSGAYVNYPDFLLPDWADAYYGANLPRLRAVKKRYDPDRLFDFPQAIPSA